MLSPKLQNIVRLVYCAMQFLTMNLADLRTEIGTIIPRIIELLSNNDSDVRQASINALSKLVEHGRTSPLCYATCLS